MKCLTDAQIQMVADGEASEVLRDHAKTCGACGARVRERAGVMASVAQTLDVRAALPQPLIHRLDRALAASSGGGATRLRRDGASDGRWRRAAWSAAAVALATLVAVLFVAPMVRGPATVLSASEILAASARSLARPIAAGVELLEYEAVLDGAPRDMMPGYPDGAYHVKQAIDHGVPGRFRMSTYTPDGQLLSSVSQDPTRATRVMAIRVDDQAFRFEFTIPAHTTLNLLDFERMHMQASVAMMQASGNQHVQVIDSPAGRQYRIEVPRIGGSTSGMVWDLTEAQILIDATDYHVVEFAVKGSVLKQPYSVSYRLIDRQIKAQASAGDFDVPADPGAISLHGEGNVIPASDAMLLVLRELAKSKQGR